MANVMKNQDNGKTGGKRSLRDVKLSLLREFDPQTAISVFDVLKEYPEKEWRTILTIARSWIKSGQWGSPRNQIKSVMDWLGGDYRNFDYSGDCFVLDNPPFSILAEIRDFYAEHNIGYFLFAPSLTLFTRLGKNEDNVTYIVAAAKIVYENGAEVRTSFITNRMPGELRVTVRGDLFRRVKEATDRMEGMTKKKQPHYVYPARVISSALLNKIAERDIILDIPARECEYIRALDSQRAAKKSIFGNGFLLSDRLAAERLAAERLAAREVTVWELSERENEIIKRLSANP